jgi:hypothetical protein
MEYLSDEQMRHEKPIKDAYTKENNALQKYLHQSGNGNSVPKKESTGRINVYYSPRTNRIIVLK